MADGVRFDIAIEANGVGVDATTEQLNALADRIQFTDRVATSFDRAVAATRARLDEASAAAKLAADALKVGEKRYTELEAAANKAAKALELAKVDGEPTEELAAAASAAAAKMREQASAVDALRARADAANAAQSKLAGTLKTLEGQQATAAASIRSGISKELAAAGDATKKVGTPESTSNLQKYGSAVSKIGSATKVAAAAWAVFAVAGVGALGMLGKTAFAIPQNAANMQRLQMATARMQVGFKQLFSGLKWDGFTRGLGDVMTLFDAGTSSANGMKKLVETIFQPLIDGATKAAPYVKEMFKGLIYGALQVVIAVLKIRNEIFKAMSPETRAAIKGVIDRVFTMENAFKLGVAIAVVLAAVFVALTVALISLAASELLALLPILLIVAAIAAVIAAFVYWDKIVAKVKETLTGWVTAAKDAAKNLVTGIVDGIKNGAGAVVEAIKNLATGAIDAFKEKLGIKSPSTVMKLQAKYTADGYVEGIEDAEGRVSTALESMVSPSDAANAGAVQAKVPAAPSSTSTGARPQVVIQQLTIGDGPVAQDNWSKFKQAVAEVLEGAVITVGGGEAPAT